MKKFHVIALTLLLGVAFILIQSLALIGGRTAGGAARSKRKAQVSQTVSERTRLSERITLHAAGRGRPWINLQDGHDLMTSYTGASDKLQFVESDVVRSDLAQLVAQARPLALASGDFDEDGVPDLISGYDCASCSTNLMSLSDGSGVGNDRPLATAPGSAAAGLLTLHRGNVDAIYPNTVEAEQRKAAGELTDAPFLSPARVFATPLEPDFIGAGDFDADGHLDLVMAARGSNKLYWMAGDGHGGLGQAHEVTLPGKVTAMTVGEINRRDGLADVVVGIDRAAGAQVLVFEGPEGALKHEPEVIALPAPATSLALGQLDDSYEMDLAVAAGNNLVIVHGRDRKLAIDEEERAKVAPPEVESREMPFILSSIAIGNFTRNDQEQIASLSNDGVIHVIERSAKQAWGKVTADIAAPLRTAGVSLDAAKTNATLVKARVSVSGFDDMVVVDSIDRQLHIVSHGVQSTDFSRAVTEPRAVATGSYQSPLINHDTTALRSSEVRHYDPVATARGSDTQNPTEVGTLNAVTLDVEGELVAVLPMRLNIHARSSLVVLKTGGSSPLAVTLPAAVRTFTVNSTGDEVNANCSAPPNICTLRRAIYELNLGSGGDTINFSVVSVTVTSPLGEIAKAVTIDGGSSRVEIKGSGLVSHAANCTFQGLVINGASILAGITLDRLSPNPGGNCFVQGNYIGTDAAGATVAVSGNSNVGVVINTGDNNTIGGTTPAARNVIAGFPTGVSVASGPTGTQVQGNYIGTDSSGTRALGNSTGLRVDGGTTVGGTVAFPRNIISGNSSSGIVIVGNNNLIQGNYIGTDVNGISNLGNVGEEGVYLGSTASNNLIGGTAGGAGNIIAFNKGVGVRILGGTGNAVRRNSIFANLMGGIGSGPRYPTLNGTTGTLSGAKGFTANTTYTIEFFTNDACGSSGAEQAKNFIGDTSATTDGSGNATFNVPAGQNVTATASATGQNTSTISNCVAGVAPTPTPTPTPSPQISLNPTQLNFSAIVNGPNPASQTVTLTNTGGSTLNWNAASTIDSPPGANWLAVTSPSGTSGTLAPNQSTILTISVTSTNLLSDIYTGTISVSSANASNSPQTVNVTLTIGCPITTGNSRDSFAPTASCTDILNIDSPTPAAGSAVSEMDLKTNGLRARVSYLLQSVKQADIVLRLFDQDGNRIGSSLIKSITRPDPEPNPIPSEDFVILGSSISLFPCSKDLQMYALLINPLTGNVIKRSPVIPYTLALPKINGLDQKIATLNTPLRLKIHGENFALDDVPELLKADGTVDSKLTLSNIVVTDATQILVDLFVAADAELGPRNLRITRRGCLRSDPLANTLNVIGMKLKVSQGVQVPYFVDRIANHPTVARFSVQNASDSGLTNGFQGLLYVFSNGQQIPGSPFPSDYPLPNLIDNNGTFLLNEKLFPKPAYSNQERFGLQDSLNFYLDSKIPQGQFTFALAIDPKSPTDRPLPLSNSLNRDQILAHREFDIFEDLQTYDFVTSKPLRILAIADPRLSEADAQILFNKHQTSLEFLKGAYPVDGTHVRMQTLRLSKDFVDIDYLTSFFIIDPIGKILSRLTDVLNGINNLAPTPDRQYDRIILLLTERDILKLEPICGITYFGASAALVGCATSTMAHEIGHTFGLGDTYSLGTPSFQSINPRRADALPDGNRVEDGAEQLVPLRTVSGNLVFPILGASASVNDDGTVPGPNFIHYQKRDFMGANGSANCWVDLVDWNYLSTKFVIQTPSGQPGPNAAGAADAHTETADLLTVRGTVDLAGNLSDVSVKRGAVIPDPGTSDPGDFTIELLNASGQVLFSTSFGVSFIQPDIGLLTGTSFSVSTPFPAGTVQVRIRKGATVLFSRPVSANQPSVQVLSPQGGETLSGSFTINWTANDPDGDPLNYSVFYLRGGTDPIPIATDLTTTSFQWSDPTLNGGGAGGRIVVVASDGVNEGSGTSQAFTVNKRGPVVTILSPNDGLSVPVGTGVVLSGAGFDPEDGILPATSLSFRSSIDGDLGAGGTVVRTLSKGVHTITLRGVDQDGNVSASSITVTVGDASQVPVITNLSPASGAVGATVTLTGQNFDPSGSGVRFGANPAPISSASSTQLVVSVPAGLPLGDTVITVTARGFSSNQVPFKVINGKPLLSEVSPNAAGPGTTILIRGIEFAPTATGNTVTFGNTQATILSADTNNLLVTVPSGLSPGTVNVTVTTAQGLGNSLPFTVVSGGPSGPVVINNVSPSAAPAGATITITGTGFSSVVGRDAVNFGAVAATATSVTGSSVQATVPMEAVPGLTNIFVAVNGYPSNPLPFTVTSATTNPLDDAQFFVRQHYLDFLEREPDPGGMAYWTGQLTQCGSDPTCIRSKRIDVSNAFFYELEYQQTAAYVFRLYRASYGNNQPFPNPDSSNPGEARKLPSYAAFAPDRSRVVGGSSLAQSQLDLANALVQRAEFLAKYPANLDGSSFIDAVLNTIKNDSGADLTSQRAGLITLFNSGGRGAVLYRLADDNIQTNPINNRAFVDAEYNRAFVASQYFGYLRRDADIGGFLFWLGQVNSAPLRDVPKQHAMVCSFITSAEYQLRFSPVVTHTNVECPQ